MNERMERVLEKMRKKGIDQLLVSDPLSIRFLTGITVNPGERLYALLLRTSGKHTIFIKWDSLQMVTEYHWLSHSFLETKMSRNP